MSDKARTVSDLAVRKASRERLLRDFREAARDANSIRRADAGKWGRDLLLAVATHATSRTRYACLMTAFGL